MRAEDPLGRRLIAAEIPDCECDDELLGCGCDGPCDCPTLLPPPCEHVLEAEHTLSVARWAVLLRCYDPQGYDDPPTAPGASSALTRAARLAVMEERAEDGYEPCHPLDLDVLDNDLVAVQAAKGRREAGLCSSVRKEPGPDKYAGDDVLSQCARAARDRTPPPVHETGPLRTIAAPFRTIRRAA